MNITIYDWTGGMLLNKKQYFHNQVVEGTINDVFVISNDLFKSGLNVMITHNDDDVIIYVDYKKFQQR
jgi:hypothetical protein